MDKIHLMFLLYFFTGFFFGMGFQEDVWSKRKSIKKKNDNRSKSCDDPLPVPKVERDS